MQINRFSLADGLAQLGYAVPDSEIDRLLDQLAAVPGVELSSAVSKESFAASQLDWEALQGRQQEDWEGMARAAFDALDLDGDGTVHRSELQIMLVGHCPEEVRRRVSGLPVVCVTLAEEAAASMVLASKHVGLVRCFS